MDIPLQRPITFTHPSGLRVTVGEMPGRQSTHALFATRYGSVDTRLFLEPVHGTSTAHFSPDGVTGTTAIHKGLSEPCSLSNEKSVRRCACSESQNKSIVDGRAVPAGVAHFLEHKLFESEDGDAFARFAKTGASANAYTSFDCTAYLFTCSQHAEESLEILLDFVQSPHFTEETVAKEQGIIGQEIRMGEDSPYRNVFLNLLQALYKDNPVNIDIAGTADSIAGITPALLYDCYHAAYNLHNMELTVTGQMSAAAVRAVCDRTLKPAPAFINRRAAPAAEQGIVRPFVEQRMPVAAPLFYLGFKQNIDTPRRSAEEIVAASVLLDMLAGKASSLYARLMEQGLINDSFGTEYFEGHGFAVLLVGGESADPAGVAAAVRKALGEMKKSLDEQAFIEAQRAAYGHLITAAGDVEAYAELLLADGL
ncbi:MAG: insulinase family protein, partial [Oscillospiraceae bacterium]|nr:insulinase family protein [Oscillospiraceae bacterium]